MDYKKYPVPPPEGYMWRVEVAKDGRSFEILLNRIGEEGKDAQWNVGRPMPPLRYGRARLGSNKVGNRKRIMNRMVVMVLEYNASQQETGAVEGLLGAFK